MATPHLRNAFLTICNLRNELEQNTEVLIMALFLQGAGKRKTLDIFEDGNNDSIIYLDPSSDETSVTQIESLTLVKGGIMVNVFDPDGNDERDEINLSELGIQARIELIQFMLDAFD
jgi:hypothetical protein